MSLTADARQEAERLLRTGQKLQAIKYLHDHFRISLADGKQLVEALEAEMANTTATVPAAADYRAEAERLLRLNKKIEAIKYVQQQANTSLKEALRRVEEIQQRINPSFQRSPRAGAGLKKLTIIMGLVALALFGIAALVVYFQEKTIGNSELVSGTIIRLERSGKGSKPVVEYSFRGKHYQRTSSVSSTPPAFDVGEKVDVFVNKDNPEDIVMNTFSERWLAAVIVGGIGSVFLFFTILFGRFFKP